MPEKWSSVVGYEGLYEVSDLGRVRSVRHVTNGITVPPKELAVKVYRSQRYARVRLYKGGKSKDLLVHRLVAQAFVPNIEGKPQVNHIDGDKLNNSASNLEWCTQAENNVHAVRNGLQDPSVMLNATRKKVLQLSLSGEPIMEWPSLSDAARGLGLQVSNISHCCSGRIKSTGGFRWQLVSEN